VPLTFGTAEELARRDEVDLVVVTVKVPNHREVVTTALQAGRWFCASGPSEMGWRRPKTPVDVRSGVSRTALRP
jgi:hypothetical protein